jgi:hypothetical protein
MAEWAGALSMHPVLTKRIEVDLKQHMGCLFLTWRVSKPRTAERFILVELADKLTSINKKSQ